MGIVNLIAAAVLMLVAAGAVVLIHRIQRPQRKTYGYALANRLPGDPGELGFAFGEERVSFADGSATVVWKIRGGAADGPVMIVCHGWNSSRYGAVVRVPLLAAYSSSLVVYDLRGHGDSTAPTSRLGTTEADDLLEIVDQLEDQDTPVVLFGASMGAGTVIAAAAAARGRSRSRIRAVIAEAPYRYFRQPIAGQLRRRKLPAFPLSHLATAWMAVRLGGLRLFDRAALASRMACPLLVLHGTADPVCPVDAGRQIAASAADGRIVEIDGGGHGGLASVDEAAYIRAVGAFLSSV